MLNVLPSVTMPLLLLNEELSETCVVVVGAALTVKLTMIECVSEPEVPVMVT